MTFEQVADYYIASGSIRDTAQKFNISCGKCRKILLTAGVLSSSVSSAVVRLREEGLTSEQIAEQLSIKRSAVNANTPYSKGIYNSDFPSANALRIRKHRSKEETIPQAHEEK